MGAETLSRRPPSPVLAAIGCVVLQFGISVCAALITKWHQPKIWLIFLGFGAVYYFFVRSLYRGDYGARDVAVILGGLSLLMPFFGQQPIHWNSLAIDQFALVASGIALLLLPRSSRGWFARAPKVG